MRLFNNNMNEFHHPTHVKLNDNMNSFGDIKEHRNQWSPYEVNEGTVAAVVGKDCVVLAGDTRVSRGNWSKIHKLNDNCYLLSSGMIADINALREKLDETIKLYEFKMKRKPGLESLASLLSKTLYGKRFFPYYTFNLLVGIGSDGKPKGYGYDAIGSYGSDPYGVQGSGKELMTPVLDNQFEGDEIRDILVDAFQSAAERDIYTGDSVEVMILRAGKEPEKNTYPLRRD